MDAAYSPVVAVDGELAPSGHQELLLLAVRVVRALPPGRNAEHPVDAPYLERDL
jgi:hypothetical protein